MNQLRISYVHEVNNNRTQLLSMSHTTILFLMHPVFHDIILNVKITNEYTHMFFCHDCVTPSRTFLLVVNSSILTLSMLQLP
jgi:hypothetical protein